MVNRRGQKQTGFTLVELLIVIVVIAILAAISVVAYNGIQERARDSQRTSDVSNITKALEMYYLDNGRYPAINDGAVDVINGGWATTADDSWRRLTDALEPYVSGIGSDPVSTPGANVHDTGYNYAYFSNNNGHYCGTAANQMYLLLYRFETKPRQEVSIGNCSSNALRYASPSNYRVAK